jgi:hypothetical protein
MTFQGCYEAWLLVAAEQPALQPIFKALLCATVHLSL